MSNEQADICVRCKHVTGNDRAGFKCDANVSHSIKTDLVTGKAIRLSTSAEACSLRREVEFKNAPRCPQYVERTLVDDVLQGGGVIASQR